MMEKKTWDQTRSDRVNAFVKRLHNKPEPRHSREWLLNQAVTPPNTLEDEEKRQQDLRAHFFSGGDLSGEEDVLQ